MFTKLSKDPQVFIEWNWEQIKPFADDLVQRPLSSQNLAEWVMDWSDLNRLISEIYSRLRVATTVNTADQAAKQRFNTFLDQVFTPSQAVNQALKQKLLASGLEPEGFEIPLRNMRVEAAIFRQENLPLQAEEKKLANEYDEIVGEQTVEWKGQEVTPTQLEPVYRSLDRSEREKAWRLVMERKLADRDRLNDLWIRLLQVRGQIAKNAGFPDYRAYRWQELLRLDYSPADCKSFHRAIEGVVVPAARRMYAKR
ncbi:MAG TPA: M3 family oligoendopeptidase, partial [Anaerolineales bacterium]